MRCDAPMAIDPGWCRGRLKRYRDALIGLGLALLALALYGMTLLPGIGSGDTAELQRIVPTLGLAHPTGYPLYTILGWLWNQLPLGGTPAWRLNLFSAVAAALAIGVLYLAARELGQRTLVAVAAALALAASFTFWSQVTIAEVYGLAALLLVLVLLALLRWRAGRLPFWPIGLLLGLGLAHHRSIVLLVPGLLLAIALSRLPRPGEAAQALLALSSASLLYLYLPLRAPAWMNSWPSLWQYATGTAMAAAWLDLPRLRAEGAGRILELVQRFVWPQFLPGGTLLALLGAGRLLWRDRASAALLLGGYIAVFGFCCAYYTVDVDVFLIPAHMIAALLIGEGAMFLVGLGDRLASRRLAADGARRAGYSTLGGLTLLALPALLLSNNLGEIRTLNNDRDDRFFRAVMAQSLPAGALVIGHWSVADGLRYLQEVEGQRPDLKLVVTADPGEQRQYIQDELAHGRAVYLLRPWPALGLEQQPEGQLWRVSLRPLSVETMAPADLRWAEGIRLTGYVLHPGPYHPGEAVPLALAWQAQGTPQHAYMLFVHLIGDDGAIWGQHDREPSAAPTDRWRAGERYIDIYSPVVHPDAPPGRYRVHIGWFDLATLHRLALAGADGAPGEADYAVLGEIEVQAAP